MPSRRLPRRIPPARPLDRHMQEPPLEDVVFQRGFYWDADAGGLRSGHIRTALFRRSHRIRQGASLSSNRRLNARLAAAVKIRGVETAEGRPAPFQSAAQIKYRSSGKRSLTLRWHPSRTSRPSRAIFPASRYKTDAGFSGRPRPSGYGPSVWIERRAHSKRSRSESMIYSGNPRDPQRKPDGSRFPSRSSPA